MMDNCFWNAAINRMYYACYYAAFIYFDRDTAETLYPQAETFINLIEELIDKD